MGYKSVKNMSRKQQKAVFARMGDGRTSFTNQDKSNRTKLLREMSYKDLKAKGHKFKSKDADKDDVPNSKDCKPLDKNKQLLLDFLTKPKIDKSLDITKRRLTFEEFKRSKQSREKLQSYHWKSEKWINDDLITKYVKLTYKYHKDKPDTGDFLDEQLGYNKSGETPVYGRGKIDF